MYDADVPEELSWRITRTQLLLETGLPLEYIDNLGVQDVGDIIAYKSGKSKGDDKLRSKASKTSGKGKGRKH